MNIVRKAAEWLSDLISGGAGSFFTFGMPSYAGKVVTPENALQVAAIWSCIKILSETEGTLPLQVFRRNGDATSAMPEHPLYRLLHDEPNPEMSAADFRMSQTAQLALWGNCYSRIARNGAGDVVALWPLQSRLMKPKRDTRGELIYEYSTNGQPDVYQPSDILHVRTLSLDGVTGISPIVQLTNPVGLAMALEEYASRFFGNGAIPALVLEHPARIGPEANRNIRDSWKKTFGGLQHSHEVVVLEENMKATVLGVDPQKSQSVESRKFQIQEIARIYRIPPHMLADLERSSFSNIEQQSLEFVVYTLMPWLEMWEQAINRTLFTAAERKTYFAEHKVDGLLRGDIKSRYEAYAIGRNWGWLSPNDVRRLENLNSVDGGDIYLTPLNMVPAGSTVATPGEAIGEQDKAALLKAAVLMLASRN